MNRLQDLGFMDLFAFVIGGGCAGRVAVSIFNEAEERDSGKNLAAG